MSVHDTALAQYEKSLRASSLLQDNPCRNVSFQVRYFDDEMRDAECTGVVCSRSLAAIFRSLRHETPHLICPFDGNKCDGTAPAYYSDRI